MSDLTQMRCIACEGGIQPLGEVQIEELMNQVPGWSYLKELSAIERTFNFANFHETMAFVNAVAWVAHRENHHPDLTVGYSKVVARYNTHAVQGLTENDFICAAKVNQLID